MTKHIVLFRLEFKEDNNGKKLPLAKPMIEAFSWQSTILAILQTDEQCEDWIYSNYVQMYSVRNLFYNYNNFTAEISFFYNLDGSWCFYECKTNPWLDYFKIQRKIVGEKWKSIVDFVIERIDSSEYVYIPIERKYISAYKGLVNSHTMLIYGYDMEKRTFFCADNFNRRYLFDMVSFDELELAFSGLKFENLKPEITNNYSDIFDISIFKKIAPSWNLSAYKFHLSKLINDIKEYLLFDGYGMAYRNNDRFVFGIECYDALITYMWDAYLNQSDWYDFRAFRAFADHKIVMLKRLDYLEKKGYISSGKEYSWHYQRIADEFNLLMNKIAKINIRKNPSEDFILDICGALKKIKDEETTNLLKLINELEDKNDRK